MSLKLELEVTDNDGWCDDTATIAQVEITPERARRILVLQKAVKELGVFEITEFNYTARWLKGAYVNDPPEARKEQHLEEVTCECNCLVVSDDYFKWTAFLKHTSVEMKTDLVKISEVEELAKEEV